MTIAESLLKIKAVKLSPDQPFTWASGIKSPIYCDNRKTLSYPDVRDIIKQGFVDKAAEMGEFDIIAGVATAGIPHGALLADAIRKPFIYIRNKPKDHGLKNMIEGELPEGARVLVIEDLISTGGSSLQAVEAVREAGGVVVGVLAIFTYGFPEAVNAFAGANCPFKALTDYPTLLDTAVSMGYIEQSTLSSLHEWSANPKGWRN